MDQKIVKRTLKCIDPETGTRVTAILEIAEGDQVHRPFDPRIARLKDPETGEGLHTPFHMSVWNPVGSDGMPIDAQVRLESTTRGACITALTPSRKADHPAFEWLRALATELLTEGIRYEPYLRKDERMERRIIDVIRVG